MPWRMMAFRNRPRHPGDEGTPGPPGQDRAWSLTRPRTEGPIRDSATGTRSCGAGWGRQSDQRRELQQRGAPRDSGAHGEGISFACRMCNEAGDEKAAVRAVLEDRNSEDAIVRAHGAHYRFTVKGNAPATFETLKAMNRERDAERNFSVYPVRRCHAKPGIVQRWRLSLFSCPSDAWPYGSRAADQWAGMQAHTLVWRTQTSMIHAPKITARERQPHSRAR